MASQISISVEVFFVLLGRIPIEDASINEHQLVDTVGTPSAVVIGLYPSHTYHRIVVIGGMAEVNLNHGLIVRQTVTPNQGIRGGIAYHLRIVLAVNAVQPVDVLAIVHIADLGAVHQEGRHGDLARRVVPRISQVVGCSTHHEGSTFDGNQAGTDFLVVHFSNFKATVVGIVVSPTRRA